ncbi:MAG TPA: SDR family oxidoreductase [Actinocatenispora sp.]
MILVAGATGTIGTELLRVLTAEGVAVRAMTRDPARLRVAGVDAVRADYGDPASLARAVAGAESVFLLTAPSGPVAEHDRAMVDAARTAGVARVVKLSAIRVPELDELSFHLPGERLLVDSGLGWTVLRPASFASNTLSWAPAIRAGEPVPNPTGTGRQPVVDPRDVAAVAARVLTGDGHDKRVYTLTGPDPISVPEQAEQLAAVLGRPVRLADVSPSEYRDRLLAAGVDAGMVEVAARGSAAVRNGVGAATTDDVARVLGRPPTRYADWARAHRDAFPS